MPQETVHGHDPTVSIIITNYQDRENLVTCLSAVSKTNYSSFEIIVVDYGTEDLERSVTSKMPQVKLLHLDEDRGVASARNIGVLNSHGELLVFLDNDTVPDPDWLKKAVPLFTTYSHVGAIQPLLLDSSNPTLVDSAGSFIDVSGYPMERGRLFDLQRESEVAFRETEPIFGACSAALIVRREVLERVGGFDDTFIIQLEDLDLSWRIRLAGYGIFLVPDSKVLHGRRSKAAKDSVYSRKREFYSLRNQMLCLIKNMGGRSLLLNLPSVAASNVVRCLMPRKAISVLALRAFLWNMIALHASLGNRRSIQNIVRRVPDSEFEAFIVPFPVILVDVLFGREALVRLVRALLQKRKRDNPF